ncbi:MAG TPA: hypothetical protein PK777_16265, partial [Thermoguttaceae bacterium]|nr:hypothetical protein [Thermoguttaceae bacterium]
MSGGMALGGPLSISPLLDFRFTDATSTTVPNHGLLGSGGNATLASGTTVVSGPTPVQRLGYENAYLLIDSSSDRMYTVDIDALDTLGSFTISFFVKPVGNFGDWREMMGDTDSTTPPAFYNGWYLQGRNINGSTSPRNYAFLLVGPGSSSSVQFTSADDYIVPNTWQHLTLVVTGLQESGTHIMQVD